MHRRTVLFALIGLLVAGLMAATYLVARPQEEKPTVTLLYPKEPADRLLWPMNNSWIWSVNRLDPSAPGNSFSVVVRMVHQPLKPGESPAPRSQIISHAESNAELHTGKVIGVGKKTDPLIVAVQLIDMNDIAAPVGKGRLRLLVKLRWGAGMVSWLGEFSVIEGESCAGTATHDNPQWKGGELHLQNLFVRTVDGLTIYDVIVVQSVGSGEKP